MKFIFSYLSRVKWRMIFALTLKMLGALLELLMPYVLEYLIDEVAPTKQLGMVFFWGGVMILLALGIRFINVAANRNAIKVARDTTFAIRRDLFSHSMRLSGSQMDHFGLPSLISRMTTDSYNVQGFCQSVQMVGIRAPIMLVGGIIITMTMDTGLSSILCVLAPIMIVVVVTISRKGIPLYTKVQQSVDKIVLVMRENITGIRVVKALSKEKYEIERFRKANEEMTQRDVKSGVIMSLPGPIMQVALNSGLTLVVIIGAQRVNSGVTEPGVILAFLTYFNMIMMGVMGLNRIFMMMSKANASANRISEVVATENELKQIPEEQAAPVPEEHKDDYIVFDHVSFRYGSDSKEVSADQAFAGEERQKSLSDVSFAIKKGGSLGIIGPTGCGKSTIINLLMRFYDPIEGNVFLEGQDLRRFDLEELHRKFGVVFQNDIIFADTLAENIAFGRDVTTEDMEKAVADACAMDILNAYPDRLEHLAAIRGANFSGGQRQRYLIARALAANPDILILDDSSSALDYKTDASLRKAIREHHSNSTTIMIAQRISSIMSLDQILVMEEGQIIGYGTHEELMKNCPQYQDIYQTQMGEEG